MLSIEITKKLAPLEDAKVDKVAIQRAPKLLTTPRHRSRIKSTVIRSVAYEVHTQNVGATKTSATVHLEN